MDGMYVKEVVAGNKTVVVVNRFPDLKWRLDNITENLRSLTSGPPSYFESYLSVCTDCLKKVLDDVTNIRKKTDETMRAQLEADEAPSEISEQWKWTDD
jgi:hypothetical protein